jgi:hypothetical protein
LAGHGGCGTEGAAYVNAPWVRVSAGLFLLGLIALGSTSDVTSRGRVDSSLAAIGTLSLGTALVVALAAVGIAASGYAIGTPMSLRRKLALMSSVVALVAGAAAFVHFTYIVRGAYPSDGWDVCIHGTYWENRIEGHFVHPDVRDRAWVRPAHDTGVPCKRGHGRAANALERPSGGGRSAKILGLIAGGSLAALVVVIAGLGFVGWRRRRRRAASHRDDDFRQVLDASLDDLRREPDVRRAIIACYARMERALANSHRGREAHETPFEFLGRVLQRVAEEPGRVLTELFESAKFSIEPMDVSDKNRAIGALERLRGAVTA